MPTPRHSLQTTSPWEKHKGDWLTCTRCFLHEMRERVVLAKGKIPCDVLFVGEAPGVSEDVVGLPFVGPTGKLLDSIIDAALQDLNHELAGVGKPPLRLAFTNVVGCIPNLGDGGKAKDPPYDCVRACRPRLEEIVRIAAPRLLVAVGSLAEQETRELLPNAGFVSIVHPAFILRSNVAAQGLLIQKCEVNIRNAAEEVFVPR